MYFGALDAAFVINPKVTVGDGRSFEAVKNLKVFGKATFAKMQ